MMNALVYLGNNVAVRADEVKFVKRGIQRTTVVMTNGVEWSIDMPVTEVVSAVNAALNQARAALVSHNPPEMRHSAPSVQQDGSKP